MSGHARTKDHSLRRTLASDCGSQNRGSSVDKQNVGFEVWCGAMVLAMSWAYLQLWRARRALDPARQDLGAQQNTSVSVAVAEPIGPAVQ
jgi:hypothetical protein